MPDTDSIGGRSQQLIDATANRLAEAFYLAATADDEDGRREADDRYRTVMDVLMALAADNPGLLAEMIADLLEPMAKRQAAQMVAAAASAMVCLDRPALIPEFRARRTR